MANRPARAAHECVVTRVEQLTPHMVRVVVGGEALTRIEAGQFTDLAAWKKYVDEFAQGVASPIEVSIGQ